jgi:hypothetical protein
MNNYISLYWRDLTNIYVTYAQKIKTMSEALTDNQIFSAYFVFYFVNRELNVPFLKIFIKMSEVQPQRLWPL